MARKAGQSAGYTTAIKQDKRQLWGYQPQEPTFKIHRFSDSQATLQQELYAEVYFAPPAAILVVCWAGRPFAAEAVLGIYLVWHWLCMAMQIPGGVLWVPCLRSVRKLNGVLFAWSPNGLGRLV
ncbi:hypothetical protein Nepgr_015855 [Nepenthes gracilis]|uniref:Uncharacterized protein n=1 Tax=Nepenthes gracilis TaxID=150966 RepID=A0AAD3SNI6_NEPGR|nr:hypothetical protein Nepgr_015855 [Nepenthes gracilis]